MSKCCDRENPLIRDGVSQDQRQVKNLLPDSVKVDERKLADFLVFAHHLSEKINYYTEENSCDGNWQDFFAYNTPVIIATIIKQRPKRLQRDYADKLKKFSSDPSDTSLLDIMTGLFDTIRNWHASLETYTPLKSTIKGLANTNLRESLVEMWAIEHALRGENKKNIYTNFNKEFNLKLGPELENISSTPRNQSQATSSELIEKLEAVFQLLFPTYRQIVQKAPHYITHSLIARQDHQPHLSLYFAFWQIFQLAQDDLNRMTQRHLDFFYRDVLRLAKRAAVPDRAHLIFELAKLPNNAYKLNANTLLKAGKDASGMEIFYKLDEEIVVHKAQIAGLKGLFLDSEEIATGNLPQNLRGLSASPVAKSFDGKGQDFPKDQSVKAWLPFGDEHRDPVNYPANLGIAIASNIFYLQESERKVILTLTFDAEPKELQEQDLPTIFTVDFSGKEKWIEGKIREPGDNSQTSLKEKTVILEVFLTADKEPIISYHSELSGASLSTGNKTIDKPVARIRLKEKEVNPVNLNDRPGKSVNKFTPYRHFYNLKLTNLTIETRVDKVRNLLLQNDLSTLDGTKPFQPFGPRPTVGSKFYIGSQEIFQKKLTELKINIEWEGLPEKDVTEYFEDRYQGYYLTGESALPDYGKFTTTVERLYNNNWLPREEPPEFNLFIPAKERNLVNKLEKILPLKFLASSKIDPLNEFNSRTKDGFLRLTLQQDFLHEEFSGKYALQVLALAKDKGQYVIDAVYQTAPDTLRRYTGKPKQGDQEIFLVRKQFSGEAISIKEPYTPVIQSLYLSYSAQTDWQDCQIFHLHPFDGFAEFKLDKTNKSVFFLPQFTNEGELLIGLKNLEPHSALPLLFQVAEETADTDLARADVEWYYLKDSTWQKFQDHQIVSDTTKGLIASGIVKLAIPADISKAKTTILDRNLHWLKVSVPARSKAICHMIDVHTQAAQVTFTDKGNDPQRLLAPPTS